MNAELIEMAKALGAVDYTPPPMRAVRGVSFTFEALDAFALKFLGDDEPAQPSPIWREISTLDLTDELVWLRKGDAIEGPRIAENDDYDIWTEWAPCTAPPMFETTPAQDASSPQVSEAVSESDGWPSPIIGLILNARSDAISLREAAQGKPAPSPFTKLGYREYLERIADSLDVAINSAEAFMRTTAFPRGTVAGYVIEHADGDRWRTMDSLGMPVWTDDIAKALCVTIREHAERFSEDDPEDIRIKAAQPTPLHLRVIESPLDVQFATANDAELTEGLWTFKMIGNDWRVAAGEFAIVPANKYRELAQDAAELRTGHWISGEDYLRNVKALDEALNGPGGATRPLLIDILAQVQGEVRRRGAPLLQPAPRGANLTWRDTRTDSTYTQVGTATLADDTSKGVKSGALLMLYRDAAGMVFARERDEFMDGRFERFAEKKPTCGVLAGEPEIVGERCLDGGKCHHGCADACDRRDGCVPLTASGLTDQWDGADMNALEAGTVVEWREVTMRNLMGLADEYAHLAAVADADPDAGGCGPIASELAEEHARSELEEAMRAALDAAPTSIGENAILDIGDNLRDTMAPMEEPELVGQKIIQRGAIHALESLLKHGCTAQMANDMLASLRSNLLVINAVGREKGFEAFADADGVASGSTVADGTRNGDTK